MHIWIDVNKPMSKGAIDFIEDVPSLLKDAETWACDDASYLSVTLRSTASITDLKANPEYLLTPSAGGAASVVVTLLNKGFSTAEEALALGYFIYVCCTHFRARIAEIHIVP